MSLRLSDFGNWLQGGDKIDFLETRQGEQYVIPFTINNNASTPVPQDLTSWTFNVTSEVMSATFAYSGDTLSSVTNITKVVASRTIPGLEVVDIIPASGVGTLKIPAAATPNPSTLITPDDANTLVNIITITCTYPSSVAGFSSIRKLMLGLIVRYGN
jgi:hypothetical protein